jgi:hypothetical protein
LLRNFLILRKLRALAALVLPLVLPFALFSQTQRPPSAPAALPPVTADSLDKAKLKLPADFVSPLNLLVLSFARDQQDSVESWVQAAQQAQKDHPQLQLWVLPVSAREDVLYKWWLNSSMRSSLPASESWHYTVPLYVNKPQFLKALAIRSEKQVAVLLTDKAGLVLWRGEGAAKDDQKASLTNFLMTSPLAR